MNDYALGKVIHLQLMAGEPARPGDTLLHLSLLFDPQSGALSGTAAITNGSVNPPIDLRFPVSGAEHQTGFGPAKRVFALAGTYAVPFGPPPLIGEIEQKFTAAFTTDENWKGSGGYTYGKTRVSNVDIAQVK
jgi:hypothetical protein